MDLTDLEFAAELDRLYVLLDRFIAARPRISDVQMTLGISFGQINENG